MRAPSSAALDSLLAAVTSDFAGIFHWKTVFLALCGFPCVCVCVCVCLGTCINNAKATASDENGIQSSSGRDGSFFCGQHQSLNSVNIICWHLNILKFAPTLPSHHTRSRSKEPWTWGEALPLYSSSLFTSWCRAAPDPWLTLMPSLEHHFLLTLGRRTVYGRVIVRQMGLWDPKDLRVLGKQFKETTDKKQPSSQRHLRLSARSLNVTVALLIIQMTNLTCFCLCLKSCNGYRVSRSGKRPFVCISGFALTQ